MAKDMTGSVYAYVNEPTLSDKCWMYNDSDHESVTCDLLDDVDWKDSLRARPEHNIENKTYTSEQLIVFFEHFNDDIKLEYLDDFLENDYKKMKMR